MIHYLYDESRFEKLIHSLSNLVLIQTIEKEFEGCFGLSFGCECIFIFYGSQNTKFFGLED